MAADQSRREVLAPQHRAMRSLSALMFACVLLATPAANAGDGVVVALSADEDWGRVVEPFNAGRRGNTSLSRRFDKASRGIDGGTRRGAVEAVMDTISLFQLAPRYETAALLSAACKAAARAIPSHAKGFSRLALRAALASLKYASPGKQLEKATSSVNGLLTTLSYARVDLNGDNIPSDHLVSIHAVTIATLANGMWPAIAVRAGQPVPYKIAPPGCHTAVEASAGPPGPGDRVPLSVPACPRSQGDPGEDTTKSRANADHTRRTTQKLGELQETTSALEAKERQLSETLALTASQASTSLRIAQWLVVGVGVGLFAGGIGSHVSALDAADEVALYAKAGGGDLAVSQRRDRYVAAWTKMKLRGDLATGLYLGGTAVVVGGVLWMIFDSGSTESDPGVVRVAPAVDRAGAGLVLSGAF